MRSLDWAIVLIYLVWIVYDGLRRSKGTDKVDGYFLGNRTLPWWAIGLSVMATQMSAVTLVGTTGQAYLTGLRFIQFYFGLPLAMIVLSVTAVPLYHRQRRLVWSLAAAFGIEPTALLPSRRQLK